MIKNLLLIVLLMFSTSGRSQSDSVKIYGFSDFMNRVMTHHPSMFQAELIVKNAFEYGNAVRLKGGDPFIFGRGAEEIDYIESFGIVTEVVSGISSSMAVPASQGIPLTKRGISESFWVITGTTNERKLSKDVHLAAQSTATVVILMGMSKLSEIVSVFKKYNKSNIQ